MIKASDAPYKECLAPSTQGAKVLSISLFILYNWFDIEGVFDIESAFPISITYLWLRCFIQVISEEIVKS